MYCPKCATQNVDDARFCRSCGGDLAVVALALDGKLVPRDDSANVKTSDQVTDGEYLRRRAKGMRALVTGGVLVTVSLVILFAPMPFIPQVFPWLVIWSALFGWLAIWGAISVSHGIGRLIDSKEMKPLIDRAVITRDLLDAGAEVVFAKPRSYEAKSKTSVTESTTRLLD